MNRRNLLSGIGKAIAGAGAFVLGSKAAKAATPVTNGHLVRFMVSGRWDSALLIENPHTNRVGFMYCKTPEYTAKWCTVATYNSHTVEVNSSQCYGIFNAISHEIQRFAAVDLEAAQRLARVIMVHPY